MKDIEARRIKRDKAIADALEALAVERQAAHEACGLRIEAAKSRYRAAYEEARRVFSDTMEGETE
jgi:hypothetical protein